MAADKILVISRRFWPEKSKASEICEGLARRRLRVDVLCGQPTAPDGNFTEGYHATGHRQETYDGIRIYRAWDVKHVNDGATGSFPSYIFFPLMCLTKNRFLKKKKYHAVLIYGEGPITNGYSGFKLAKKLNIPVYIYAKDICPEQMYLELDLQNSLLRRAAENISAKMYRGADKIIVPTRRAGDYFVHELDIPKNRVEYIPRVAEKLYENAAASEEFLNKYAGSFNALYAGYIGNSAGLDVLLDVMETAYNNAVRDLRLIICGKGQDAARIKAEITRRNLYDSVFVEENLSDEQTAAYMAAADVLIDTAALDSLSKYGMSDKLADMMAAGKPVLMASGEDARSVVKEAACGYASDAGDANALYTNLMRLYKSPDSELKRMGRCARKWQQEHFNADKNCKKIAEIIAKEN